MKPCCAIALVGLLLSGSACSTAPEREPQTLFGFELAAFEGIPSVDVAVRIQPSVAKAGLVQPTSQVLADALGACADTAKAPGAMDTPHALEFTSRQERLVGVSVPEGASALEACLTAAIEGKALKGLGSDERQLTIQLRRHFELP